MSSSASLMYLKIPHILFSWSLTCLSGFYMYSLYFTIFLVVFVFVNSSHFYNKFYQFVQHWGKWITKQNRKTLCIIVLQPPLKSWFLRKMRQVNITKFLILIFFWVGLFLYELLELAIPLNVYPLMNIFFKKSTETCFIIRASEICKFIIVRKKVGIFV